MGFLAPFALAGLTLLLLPVAIHLLVRRRATRIDFPSLRYLRPTRSHQWAPRRLQQPLLLALRLLGIILLLVGLAQPFRSRAESQGKLTILLLDASFSMRAGQRVQAAREAANLSIAQMPPGERAAIIAFDTKSTVLVEPTSDRKALSEGLSRYGAGYGTTEYPGAFDAARSIRDRAGATETRVLVISDFQASGLRDEAPFTRGLGRLGIPVTAVPVGVQLERNTYWTDLRARATPAGVLFSAWEVTLTGESSTAVHTGWRRVSSANGNEPNITWHTESSGQIVGELQSESPDGMPEDDRVSFVLDRPAKNGTLLVGDGADGTNYLRAALSSGPTYEGERNDLVEAATVPVADELDHYQLVVTTLHKNPDSTAISRLLQFCRDGGTAWLLLGADLNTEAWNQFATSEAGLELPFSGLGRLDPATAPRLNVSDPMVLQNDESSDLDRLVLGSIPVTTGYALAPRKDALVALRWSNSQPAWVRSPVGKGSIVAFGTSPERNASGLGLSSVFPEMVDAVVEQAAVIPLPGYEVGTTPSLVSPRSELLKITKPDGGAITASGHEVVVESGSIFAQPGLYRVKTGGAERLVAFRPPASESEIALADRELVHRLFATATSNNEATKVSAAIRPAGESRWWRWLVIVGFVFLCFEVLVALAKRSGSPERAAPQVG